MTDIRRYFNKNALVFTTHVTFQRLPILIKHKDLLIDAIAPYKDSIIAWVILPDHFHCLLEYEDNNPSDVFRKIKLSFSTRYRKRLGFRSGRVWQYRFWDHIIRDQADLNRHIDYIHYNPVKHGCAESPFDWEDSSIHMFRERGFYQEDWGSKEPHNLNGEFGE